MSVNFIWNELYSVGDKEIDNQHRHMFDIANSLPEHIGDKSLKKTVVDLYKHILKHFDAEEAMMKETGFPGIEDHRKLHNDLISRLNEITEKSFDGDEEILRFRKFVFNWIIEHIMHHDRIFFDYVKKCGSKI